MKSKALKSLIRKARNELEWPILEKQHEYPVIRIVSDPVHQSHLFLKPDKLHNRSTDLDYLHELGHAVFCEKVHPVFAATSQFAPRENKRLYLQIIPALNSACDWFIGHWQLALAPRKAREQLREHLKLAEEVLGDPIVPPLDIILDASLVVAQAIHYLKEPIVCEGPLKMPVDAFLAIPPEKPSMENCVLLVNGLMATYTEYRARLVLDGQYHVWDIYRDDEIGAPGSEAREEKGA